METRSAMRTAVAVSLTLLVAGCTGGGGGPSPTPTPEPGGVYRTAIEDFGFSDAFDPTGEYFIGAFALYDQLLLRKLLTFRHVEGGPGNELMPDLATSLPRVSPDGLTYTFHLRSGIEFAPPVSREITSHDIEYAFERLDTASLGAQYGFYYDGVIEGMDGPVAEGPKDISGISTPNDRTIVFHLRQPTGDFPFRLTMPATAPIPREVAHCFPDAGDYGRDVVASGPYMVKGSDGVRTSSCGSIKPMSGFDPTDHLYLVRNPNYDPATDPESVRENLLDGVSIVIDSNTQDIFDRVRKGDLDGSWLSHLPSVEQRDYLTDPALKPLLHSDQADSVEYITLNLLTPPFDDVHVRRAVNLVLDKAAMQQAWGGALLGTVATHVYPPSMIADFPSYDPYASSGKSGDVTAAKEQMSGSKYDHNGDGVCDDPVCRQVLMVTSNQVPYTTYTPIIQSSFKAIGIEVKPRELSTGTSFTTIQRIRNLVPMASMSSFSKDFADPFAFAILFQSAGISCEGAINYSSVGMSPEQARACHVQDEYARVAPLPTVDPDVTRCELLPQGQNRRNCWVRLDQNLMEHVVPWIPYEWDRRVTVVAPSVTRYVYDQAANLISLCHIAVDNHIDADTLGKA